MKFVFVGLLLGILPVGADGVWSQEISQKETEQLDFAQGLLARGLYDMATGEYQKFISLYPQSPYLEEAYISVGESYFLAQDFGRAKDALVRFKELYPQSQKVGTAALRLGQIYIQEKKYEEALKELTTLDLQNRLQGQTLQSVYFYLGKASRGLNDFSSALDYFKKSVDVPDGEALSAYALQETAEIQTQNAQYVQAIEAYSKAASATLEESFKGYLVYKTGETQFLSGNYIEAITLFHQVLNQYPAIDTAQDAFTNLLLAHFNLAQYEPLLTEFQNGGKFFKEENAYFDVYFTVAKAYMELNRDDEALALLKKTSSFHGLNDGDKRRCLLKEADIFIKQKRYQEAVALAEGPLPAAAEDTDHAVFLKAQGYYGLENFEKARTFFQEVKDNYPNSIFAKAAVLGLAHCFESLKNYKEAAGHFFEYYNSEQSEDLKSEALYEAASMESKLDAVAPASAHAEEYLQKFPNGIRFEQCVLLLGNLYAQSNQSQKAVALFTEYLTHPEKVKRADAVYFLLGYNQQLLGQTDQAMESYSKVAFNKEDAKFYASALKNSAVIYLGQEKDSQAAAFFDRIISELEKNDLDVKTYLWLCGEYLKEKKFNDVLKVVQKAQERFGGQEGVPLSFFKAEAVRELKDFENAVKLYDVILSSGEKSTYAAASHIGKGLALRELKNLEAAKSEFQKAIDESADDHTVTLRSRFELGAISQAQNMPEEALKLYLLIGTIYEDDYYCPESLYRAAEILDNSNRKDEAQKFLKEILAKYPHSAAAALAKEKISSAKEGKGAP